MTTSIRWTLGPFNNGSLEAELSSWVYFHDYIREEMLDYHYFFWRGQRDSTWKLESSLDRLLAVKPEEERAAIAKEHLERFKMSVRGRRGSHPAKIDTDNEWWALGQHQGLATPLLDWTESPFVALYFAFEKPQAPTSGRRTVWALGGFGDKNNEISDAESRLQEVRPKQDENVRLVSQAGLFTRVPISQTVDEWVQQHYAGVTKEAYLLKITIPDSGRTECLRTLNKMNINHLTLFPDVYGSSQHCNRSLEIDKY